ncbi:hypothetical protein [Nostoc sp.]|uniref:hypothetical protein n=1 Tax=Nostoc sp. TaxID=1180 RepID=UPI002FEEFC2D
MYFLKVLTCIDEIIHMGLHHTHPCHHPMRLVSVLWGKTWYHYLTNVLDPQQLSAQEVCELYRRRWRIEDAFLLTKRMFKFVLSLGWWH